MSRNATATASPADDDRPLGPDPIAGLAHKEFRPFEAEALAANVARARPYLDQLHRVVARSAAKHAAGFEEMKARMFRDHRDHQAEAMALATAGMLRADESSRQAAIARAAGSFRPGREQALGPHLAAVAAAKPRASDFAGHADAIGRAMRLDDLAAYRGREWTRDGAADRYPVARPAPRPRPSRWTFVAFAGAGLD